jgi:uncharacterized protein DUF4238
MRPERETGIVPSEDLKRRLADNEKHFDIKPTTAYLLETMLSGVADIAGYIAQRTWTLVRFDEPCLFTGEAPVVHSDPSGGEHGFGVATTEQMYMPISTTHALVLRIPGRAGRRRS